ncbi:hypothetical protein FMEAI12_3560030 [Parafrankia sp. Ea1.12]|nr:hypothetical protein FMEAI12_3560030 [Parafrankia sp. Ea1.12]
MCQQVGLNWTRVRVAALERGDRETVDVGTLLLLADALDVSPGALFAGAGGVYLSATALQSREGVQRILSGAARRELPPEDRRQMVPAESGESRGSAVDADAALAGRLGVTARQVVDAASAIWGRSLTEERDARVSALGDMPPGERQAHRGHITRELAQEIEGRIGGAAR